SSATRAKRPGRWAIKSATAASAGPAKPGSACPVPWAPRLEIQTAPAPFDSFAPNDPSSSSELPETRDLKANNGITSINRFSTVILFWNMSANRLDRASATFEELCLLYGKLDNTHHFHGLLP